MRLGGFFLCKFLFADFGDLSEFAFFAFDDALVNKEVVHGVRKLCAFADPVGNAFCVDLEGDWIREWVVHAENFERLSPWIARFFTNDEAVGRLFFLSDASQTDR